MNFIRKTTSVLLFAAIASSATPFSAFADDGPKTREQVKAELREAMRTGDMPADGDSGLKLNEVWPQRYPKPATVAGKTRSQVRAELDDAVRDGDIMATGDSGRTLREEFPQRYPAPIVADGKTRAQVKQETLEAIRIGDVYAAGDSGLTLYEQNPQRYAKARAALTAQTVAKR